MSEYVIECHECAAGDPGHRADCLIALLEDIDREAPGPIPFDESEVRALHALRDGGLLPSTTSLPVRASSPRLRDTGS